MSAVETLGKHEIRRQLGHGAMGTVYEGWDPVIQRRVAIKTVLLPKTPDADTIDEIARFRREAQAAGRLSHPNIVGVFDYGETADLAYIVMEFVDGPTLKSLLDARERFPVPRIVRIMEDVLSGLQFSHERGVVHRDIKPANLMLTTSGQTKIADFGIARIESASITQAGTVLGTPAYMSPEQFMGQVVDARTDIYSSGVLLYQLLTGERPFEGAMASIMHKALHLEVLPPSRISMTTPRRFDAVIKRALAKRPEDRYSSAAEFATAVREAAAAPEPPPAELDNNDETTIVASPRSLLAAGGAAASGPANPPVVSAATAAPGKPASIGGGTPGAKSPLRPRIIAAGLAGLAVLGGVAWFVLSGNPPMPAPPPRRQEIASLPRADPPAPAQPSAVEPPVNQTTLPPAAVSPTDNPPPTVAPPLVEVAPSVSPPPVPASPPSPPLPLSALERVRTAARSVPCSALKVSGQQDGLTLSGVASGGQELDQFLSEAREAGLASDDIRRVDRFACTAISAVSALARQSWESSPRTVLLTLDPQDPVSGARLGIDVASPSPNVYADLYRDDGSVRHLLRPASSGVPNNPHATSVIAPAAGPGLIVAIGAATPLDLGARPETERAATYLAALQSRLREAPSPPDADIAVVTVRPGTPLPAKMHPPEPVGPRLRPTEPAVVKETPSRPPALRSARCSNILSRAQLGETLSDGEITALRTECRS